MRILLIHPVVDLPRRRAPHGPFINIMAQGLMGLADCLERAGHAVEILHSGVERRLDAGFDAAEAIRASRPDLVGISLHWHPQMGPVGALLDRLARQPDPPPVVLGGMTASAFAEQILDAWPAATCVIRGEADDPLVALAEVLKDGPADRSALAGVPNLSWRDGDRLRSNPLTFVADSSRLDGIRFCRRDLVRHGQHYNAQFGEAAGGFEHAPVFYLTIGRGCTLDCSFCSGGASGQRRLAGRQRVVFRSPDAVLEDMRRALDQGHSTLCVCFDPPPRSEAYQLDLFGRVRRAGLRPAMVFECYRPPSEDFVQAFARTFATEGSRLSFSPTVEDEGLRQRLLGSPYSNASLERILTACRQEVLETSLYFATIPMESRDQLERSLKWQARLVERFGCRLIHAPIEMEPGAPWELDSKAHGLTEARRGFAAYLRRHGPGQTIGRDPEREVGYRFDDLNARLVRIRSQGVSALDVLGSSLAEGGPGAGGRCLLPAAGREAEALDLAGGADGGAWTVLWSDLGLWPDWGRLQELARRLGPWTRTARFDPQRVSHRRFRGDSIPDGVDPEGLLVLHLTDARAAEAWLEGLGGRGTWRARAVVAGQCRFRPAPCPARGPGLVALGRDGGVRACADCADLGPGTLAELRARVEADLVEAERVRGCQRCPVRQTCSRCPYPGAIGPEDFCRLRRRLGAAGLGPGPGREMGSAAAGQPAVGWDD